MNLPDKQARVYAAILCHGPINDRRITELTGIPINPTTTSRHKLMKRGLIQEVGKVRTEDTHKAVSLWSAGPPTLARWC